jgi:hypothetical protein
MVTIPQRFNERSRSDLAWYYFFRGESTPEIIITTEEPIRSHADFSTNFRAGSPFLPRAKGNQ